MSSRAERPVTLGALADISATTRNDSGGVPITRSERFEAMFRTHERRVLGYALRRAPVEQAKDAVAETFLAAWRRFDELPREPLPWLLAATRRTLANQRRSSARQTLLAERVAREAARPSADDSHGEALEQVRTALAALGDGDREALMLVAWEELSPSEAARVVGCSAVAFRVRLHRARRRLATALNELECDDSLGAVSRRSAPHVEEV